MTNKQLLELAAKASGIDHDGDFYIPSSNYSHMQRLWDPQKDDGDAFRLAVRLRIEIRFCGKDVVCAFGGIGEVYIEYTGRDSDAATRLAITRAAASIGAAMGDNK